MNNLAKRNYKQMKSPPVGEAHDKLKMKKQTKAKQPTDCTDISHYFFMGFLFPWNISIKLFECFRRFRRDKK